MMATPSVLLPALQQPVWPDPDQLWRVQMSLHAAEEPVDLSSREALSEELAGVAAGHGFLVTGGDCAELFSDAAPARVVDKARHLHAVADIITRSTGLPTTRIGRFGGQFAKPRSSPFERLRDGRTVPSYRGDAVNGLDPYDRVPDPERLLTAHTLSCGAVRAVKRVERVERVERGCNTPGRSGGWGRTRTYFGHEALLLDYERPLLRESGRHASSGHYLWIGDRTRQMDHAHLAFAAAIDNPVGVKVGPSVEPAELRALVEKLDPEDEHRPGRLSLILRLGAGRTQTHLPALVEGLGARALDVLWVLDPLHGNGRTTVHGTKTRVLTDILEEVRDSFATLRRYGLRPNGIHLEMTPDEVTECVDDPSQLACRLPRFESACDPRLNAKQSATVAELAAGLLNRG